MNRILILMRHAQAAPTLTADGLRPLTPQGRQQALHAAAALARAGLRPRTLLCSPLLRALQTAQLLAPTWQLTPQPVDVLDGRLSAQGLADFLCRQTEQYPFLLCVGHNPGISLAAGLLAGRTFSFAPGQWAALELADAARPRLLAKETL